MAPIGFSSVALLGLVVAAAQNAAAAKVMPMKISTRSKLRPAIEKRAAPFAASLQNYIVGAEYFATVEVGTPPQTLELIVDTGSSDVWMFAPNVCPNTMASGPCLGGSFDSSASSSYKLLYQDAFAITYADGSGVKGNYISDDFSIGGQTITGLTMAVATEDSSNNAGIMGIGLDTRESITNQGYKPYQNLPDEMLDQGLIGTKAYSLWLDDASASTGTLLFGGYDTDKFHGDLTMMPLLVDSQSGIVDAFSVAWTSISVDDGSGNFVIADDSLPLAVTLDSGSTLATLPTNLFNVIAKQFSVVTEQGNSLVSCDLGSKPGAVNLGFGGPSGAVISVPFSELAIPSYNPDDGQWQTDGNGNHLCMFGFQDASTVAGGDILFGQSVLRSAYILYDLENQQLGIAQTNYNSDSSNIVEYNGKSSTESISSDANEPQPTYAATGVFSDGNGGFFGSSGVSGMISTGVPSGAFPAGAATLASGIVVYSTAASIAIPTFTQSFAEQAGSLTPATGAAGTGTNEKKSAAPALLSTKVTNMLAWISGTVTLGIMGGMLLL